jgi:3-hydroxybutyryl-CoA dehydrogenase
VLVPMINEAIYTLYEGVGTVDAIDTAMKLGANHPMGPLELGDFIGLDTVLSDHERAARGPGGFQVPALPAAGEVRRGRLAGRKAGRGFYDYRGETPVPTRTRQ